MDYSAETGVGDRSLTKLERLDRAVVTAATVTSAVFVTLMVVIATTTSNSEVLERAIAPGVFCAVGLWQLYWRRPNAVAQLVVGAVVVIVHVSFLGPDPTALLGLLAMGVTGGLFVQRRALAYGVASAALLFVLGLWWAPRPLPITQKMLMSTGPTLLFIFTSVLMQWMRKLLGEGQARFRNLFYRAPVPIWETDFSGIGRWLEARRAEGVTDIRRYLEDHPGALADVAGLLWVLDVNHAGIRFFGARSRESMLGAVAVDRLPPGYLDVILAHVVSFWDGNSVTVAELASSRVDGTEVGGALTSFAPEVDGALDLSKVITTITDITELKLTQRRLEELVRSKDEFVASVSHEVRTPLTAVVGLAEELRDRYSEFDAGEVQELVSVIADQSTEVAHIIEDLLVAARKEVGSLLLDRHRFDLRHEVVALVAGLNSGVAVDVDLRVAAPMTCADPSRVRQVLRNLLVNADRYGGGSTRVRIRFSAAAGFVEVRDGGPPISPVEQEAIFDPYYRARQVDGLTASVGLGLTVSRQLARLMGGDVTYAHDGSESVFTLRLPNASPATYGPAQPIEPSTSARVGVPISASS